MTTKNVWIASLVTPLIAETTTTTGRCAAAERTMAAARRMQSASPTEVPPNFITWRAGFIFLLPDRFHFRTGVGLGSLEEVLGYVMLHLNVRGLPFDAWVSGAGAMLRPYT